MSKVLEMDKKKLIAYIRLERPQFSIMSFLAACAGMIFAYKGIPDIGSLVGVGLIFWLTHNTAHPINDYFDREIDRYARPEAPIPSGDLSPEDARKSAVLHYTVVPLLIILIATVLPVKAGPLITVALFGVVLTALYSAPPIRLRRRGILKDVAIGLVLPLPFFGGWTAITGWSLGIKPIVVALVYFLLSAGAQLLADIHDMKGEKRAGWQTVPVKLGVKKAFYLSLFMGMLAVLIIPIPALMGWFNRMYIPIGAGIMILVISLYAKSFTNFNPEMGRKLNERLLMGTTFYVMAVIIGSVAL